MGSVQVTVPLPFGIRGTVWVSFAVVIWYGLRSILSFFMSSVSSADRASVSVPMQQLCLVELVWCLT